jgi:hypothetical protein
MHVGSVWTFLIKPHEIAGRIPEHCNPLISSGNTMRALCDPAPVRLDPRQTIVDVVDPDVGHKARIA